ncbi:hypothetical protein K8O93_24870 [Gordonia bronchialis]|uniref:hypothetical protein n=1 Tax=Gordonia bronchialis TaxID=2054 RepID=UPI001CBE201F|nr:hypothetical protein [Gordonia bronchialis]UAK38203.1 hypothetical protein K8O93_24870 [Gordonia bronchialis]
MGADLTQVEVKSAADVSARSLGTAEQRSSSRNAGLAMLLTSTQDLALAATALRDLADRDLLVVTGGKRYASYQLSDRAVTVADSPMPHTRSADSSAASTEGIAADLDAVEQAIAAGHVTARAIETALGMNYRAVLRRLTKLIDAGRVQRIGQRHSSRQAYRLTNEDSK